MAKVVHIWGRGRVTILATTHLWDAVICIHVQSVGGGYRRGVHSCPQPQGWSKVTLKTHPHISLWTNTLQPGSLRWWCVSVDWHTDNTNNRGRAWLTWQQTSEVSQVMWPWHHTLTQWPHLYLSDTHPLCCTHPSASHTHTHTQPYLASFNDTRKITHQQTKCRLHCEYNPLQRCNQSTIHITEQTCTQWAA